MYKLLFADIDGNLYDHSRLGALARTGEYFIEPDFETEFIPLPEGASLTMIPDASPIGLDEGSFSLMEDLPWGSGKAMAVGALLPQGYTRTLLPAFKRAKNKGNLPLLGYTAAAWHNGQVYIAAVKTDEDKKWNPQFYNSEDIEQLVAAKLTAYPANRVLKQLAKCSLDYCCLTAQNIFYGRWEGGLPSSPVCNAACLGCISLQPAECCPSPQERIDFQPTLEELTEIAVGHLENGEEAIISFGQGCEGEPSLQGDLLSRVIKATRAVTAKGTINMNTNAGYTEGIKAVCEAGINSIRVSLISARPDVYEAYYRPKGYLFSNVLESLRAAKSNGVYISLNLLVLPGLTDREEEIEALTQLINEIDIDLLQLRNLNIDPDFLFNTLPPAVGDIIGVENFIVEIKNRCPRLDIGNYSRFLGK